MCTDVVAWLISRHVTLEAVGTGRPLQQWLGPFKILAKPTQSTILWTYQHTIAFTSPYM